MPIFTAIQMNSSSSLDDNLATARQLLEHAAEQGAELAVLPENFAFMGKNSTDKLALGEAFDHGPIQRFLAAQAKALRLWIIAGSVPLAGPDQYHVRPACLVYNDQGRRVGRYDKIHLFDVDIPDKNQIYRESDTFSAGPIQPEVIDTPWGKLGLSICYDLRFPELYRALVEQGADIVVVPSAFTYTTGQAHWHCLARARAIENQVFLIAPNQAGTHNNERQTYGHSLIINAWGEILAQAQTQDHEVISAVFDAEQQHALRHDFPVLDHRRLS